MNFSILFRKYYLFLLVLLGCLYASPSFAQTCIQNGGNVPCKVSDLVYYSNGKYGKDPDALKAQYVANYCAIMGQGITNLISCSAGPSTRFGQSYDNPSYSYVITVVYDMQGGNPPTSSTTSGEVIGSTQSCPASASIEVLTGSWVYLCRPNYYASSTTVAPYFSTQSLTPPKAHNIKGNMCSTAPDSQRAGSSSVGDPIDVSTGTKTLSETDYTYNSQQPFIIQRNYNSVYNEWSFNFIKTLSYSNLNNPIVVLGRPGGKTISFQKSVGIWTEINGLSYYTLTESGTQFIVTTSDLDIEKYNFVAAPDSYSATYQLAETANVHGKKWLYSYQNGIISQITDDYARTYTFTPLTSGDSCANLGYFKSITTPGGKIFSYDYNSNCNITKVTYPDGNFKQYSYNGAGLRLNNVIDEKGNTYQTTIYNNNDYKAISEGLGSTGAIEKLSLSYLSNSVEVTDANNNVSTVNTQTTGNDIKITGYASFCPWCSGYQGSSLTYDSNGYVTGLKDYNNVGSSFSYNSKGKPLAVTQAVSTSLQKTNTYTYDASENFVTSVSTPVEGGNKVTTYTYDSNNRIVNASTVAPKNDGSSTNETRTVSLTYNTLGQLTNVYGPRYISGIVNDKTTLTYNSTGQVATSTNGLGQTTTFSNFDDFGNPQAITDAGSRVMNITYDSRGRILTSTFKSSTLANDGETTSFSYDNAGLLNQLSSPSGAYKKMFYDTAQRLTRLEEYNESNTYLGKTEFTLDNMSNLTDLKVFNASNVQIRTSTSQYDTKSRLYKDIGSLSQTNTLTYDNNSNLTQVNDAANANTTKSYDVLNRLSGQTNPDTGTIGMTYKPDGNIATVTDPKALTTSYNYNGFGETISITSPDTGTTTITRDKAGNPISYTNAKGQVSSMTYDALNRITNVDYIGASSENVTVAYDSCTIGRVCLVNDISGTQNYTYNSKGRLATKNYNNGTFSKTVAYSYNSYGQLSNITYPSGKMVNYSYVNDKISAVSYSDGITTTNIATGVTYESFNPQLSSYTWGNSATYNQAFTADGVISSITAANAYPVNKTYGYDSRFNITGITETGTPARSSTATYDSMSRINNYSYGTGNSNDYTYNTSEDRTSQKLNAGTATTYNYGSTSHKLTSLSGASTDTMTYDLNGSILTASGKIYTYNAANRMATSNDGSLTTSYLINFMGQRTQKSNTSSTTWFIYDENDNVIAEYDAVGNLKDEYVYMDNRPVALLRASNLYYIYSDHLNTPRAITDTANTLQWTWENKEAFGNNLPTEVVSGFNFNFRLPGQYFDSETNLNYNIHRDYNPVWGRYMSSDPLGLAAGINTYGYVSGNSLGNSDRLGLLPVEHYLDLWISSSPNWQIAFNLAKIKKMTPLFIDQGNACGPIDQEDADNRTAAEHYIYARGMMTEKKLVTYFYKGLGIYFNEGYQMLKLPASSLMKASKPSLNQLYWENSGWWDHWGYNPVYKAPPFSTNPSTYQKLATDKLP